MDLHRYPCDSPSTQRRMALVLRAFLLGGRILQEHKIHFLLELVSSIAPLSGREWKKKRRSSRHHHLSIVESIFVLLYITVRTEGGNFLFIKPFLGERVHQLLPCLQLPLFIQKEPANVILDSIGNSVSFFQFSQERIFSFLLCAGKQISSGCFIFHLSHFLFFFLALM